MMLKRYSKKRLGSFVLAICVTLSSGIGVFAESVLLERTGGDHKNGKESGMSDSVSPGTVDESIGDTQKDALEEVVSQGGIGESLDGSTGKTGEAGVSSGAVNETDSSVKESEDPEKESEDGTKDSANSSLTSIGGIGGVDNTQTQENLSVPAGQQAERELTPGHVINAQWRYQTGDKLAAANPATGGTQPETSAFSVFGGNAPSITDGLVSKGNWAAKDEADMNNKYWQFAFSTTDYKNLAFSAEQRSVQSGPRSFKLQYSIDSKTFIDIPGSVSIPFPNQDTADKVTAASITYKNFALPAELENQKLVYLRVTLNSMKQVSDENQLIGGMSSSQINNVIIQGEWSAKKVAPVTASPDGKEAVKAGSSVTLLSKTGNIDIFYTLKGKTTIETEKRYEGPVKLAVSGEFPYTIEAYAKDKDGVLTDSKKTSFTYERLPEETASVLASPNSGKVAKGTVVKLSCATPNATIKYQINGGAEQIYTDTTVITLDKLPATIEAYAQVKNEKDSPKACFKYTEAASDAMKYNHYYGGLHDHTRNSDGLLEYEDAYRVARDEAKMDFFAITEHAEHFDTDEYNNEKLNPDGSNNDPGEEKAPNQPGDPLGSLTNPLGGGKNSDRWIRGQKVADEFNTKDFAAIRGFEMTWGDKQHGQKFGHVNVFNTDGYVSTMNPRYQVKTGGDPYRFFDDLAAYPGALAQFNHPGTMFGSFDNYKFYQPEYDQFTNLLEVETGETLAIKQRAEKEYYNALYEGWHVAPTNNADGHFGKFGTGTNHRTVILSDSLSREKVYDAIKNGRVYATEDKTMKVEFTINDEIMGTAMDYEPSRLTVRIKATTGLEEGLGDIFLVGRNEGDRLTPRTVASVNVGGAKEKEWEFTIDDIDSDFYYVRIKQPGSIGYTFTAPIWVKGGKPSDTFEAHNLTLSPGPDASARNIAWYSAQVGSTHSIVQLAEKSQMNGNAFPASFKEFAGRTGAADYKESWHKAEITGLKPNTEYVYRLANNEAGKFSKVYGFKTGGQESFQFIALSDAQINQKADTAKAWKDTVDTFTQRYPAASFVMNAGDQVDNVINSPKIEMEYDGYFAPEALRSIPVAPTMGNHDVWKDHFSNHFNLPNSEAATNAGIMGPALQSNYWYEYNNALFVVLNTSGSVDETTKEATIQLFDSVLTSATKAHPDARWIFVQHHKSTTSSAEHQEDVDVRKWEEIIVPLMSKYKVDFVLSGHDHVYTRSYQIGDKTGPEGKITGGIDYTKPSVKDPKGTLYFTLNTASGGKYYSIPAAAGNQYGINPVWVDSNADEKADRPWFINKMEQSSTPTFSVVDVRKNDVTFTTYKAKTMEVIDKYTVEKAGPPENGNTGGGGGHGHGASTGKDKNPIVEPEAPQAPEIAAPETAQTPQQTDTLPLYDIQGHWAQEVIQEIVASQIAGGYPDGSFRPNATVTRAELIKMAVDALGIKGKGNIKVFKDVKKDSWFKKYVDAGVSAGLAQGTSQSLFSPNVNITRQDLCVILYNGMKKQGIQMSEPKDNTFADSAAISGYAKKAVGTFKELGIISGRANNVFDPAQTATRAEAAAIIMKVRRLAKAQ